MPLALSYMYVFKMARKEKTITKRNLVQSQNSMANQDYTPCKSNEGSLVTQTSLLYTNLVSLYAYH